MKIRKRLISAVLAVTCAVSSAVALNCSALFRPVFSESDEEILKGMADRGYTYVPEVIDDFAEIIHYDPEDIGGLWLTEESEYSYSGTGKQWLEFLYKELLDDLVFVYFDMSPENSEAIVAELEKELGYSDDVKVEVYNEVVFDEEINKPVDVSAGLALRFSKHNTEMNYMIAEKAVSILKEKYPLKESQAYMGEAMISDMRIIMPSVPANSISALKEFTDEKLDELNNVLSENGFKVNCYIADDEHFEKINERDIELESTPSFDNIEEIPRERRFIIDVADDMTLQEKLEYTLFMRENYDSYVSIYSQCSATPISNSFDILSMESNYLDGDANEDGVVDIADAAAIIQHLGNRDKYGLSMQGIVNADIDGDGITGADALAIQKQVALSRMPE
ncbi:MAG: dockerin type I repeat-containing protein [Ruminococcus flavefaciens]|nr:dockerin type I repeat-containing protein [Ruminococcus flavefaciens]MCM1228517.1 dockerin type I repeat-containing protein [Ruminococcus flavefaciens]